MLDSIVKVKKKCYPETLLEECKYEIKKTKMKNLINDNSDPSWSDDETDSEAEPDNESDNESNNKSENE